MAKTNAARLLDKLGIAYELSQYAVPKQHISAVQMAERLGIPPERMFKTLLARGDRHGPCFAVIPASAELDLKALSRASDNRKVAMVPLAEVTALTGYVRGGVTALAARKHLPTYLDDSALSHARISVSSGRRGTMLTLAPADYARALAAVCAPLAAR